MTSINYNLLLPCFLCLCLVQFRLGFLGDVLETDVIPVDAHPVVQPFLLGLNWSTTERMSGQQADILTSELWALRRTVEPAVRKICRTFLALEGLDDRVRILWDDISLQDITEEARAELYKAQAEKARRE